MMPLMAAKLYAALKAANVPEDEAIAAAEEASETWDLVTTGLSNIEKRLISFEANVDRKFVASEVNIDERLIGFEANVDRRLAASEANFDKWFGLIDVRFATLDRQIGRLEWIAIAALTLNTGISLGLLLWFITHD
jgi:hypothetical protein